MMINNTVFLMLMLAAQVAWAEIKPFHFIPYDEARVLFQEQKNALSYRLALGSYEKKDNLWQPEESIRLKGWLARQTHELPRDLNEKEIFEFYRDQLPKDREVLYACVRRGCGESNNWANDHFGIKQLYGFEQNQFFGVYKVGEKQFFTLYAVRRGNRKTYVQLEQLITQ